MNRRLIIGTLLIVGTIVIWMLGRRDPDGLPPRVADRSPAAAPAVRTPVKGDILANESRPVPASPTPTPPPSSTGGTVGTPVAGDAVPKSAPPGAMPPALVSGTPAAEVEPPPLPSGDIRSDLEYVQFAIRDFQTALGENPVGNNAEISKALLGENLKRVNVGMPVGSTVNAEGELCDRLGTPYFFHALSGKSMEVRSAGEDRKMWTSDDFVTK